MRFVRDPRSATVVKPASRSAFALFAYGPPIEFPDGGVPKREAGRIATARLMAEIARLEAELARA